MLALGDLVSATNRALVDRSLEPFHRPLAERRAAERVLDEIDARAKQAQSSALAFASEERAQTRPMFVGNSTLRVPGDSRLCPSRRAP